MCLFDVEIITFGNNTFIKLPQESFPPSAVVYM